MKEDFLHYVWRFQKYDAGKLRSFQGNRIQILHVGTPNPNAGPDFLMAQILIDDEQWVGHVEIHTKSSEWLNHGHTSDHNYNNVILHVVYENDAEIQLPNGGHLEVLELRNRIDKGVLENYQNLMGSLSQFIPCEKQATEVPSFVLEKWLERLYIERLEHKAKKIVAMLKQSKNHWDEVTFALLGQALGLKVNGASFRSVAESIPFTIVRKCASHPIVLEALLLGQAGLLEGDHEDASFKSLQAAYRYLKLKFGIDNHSVERPQFFRLRPYNFPTIRLSQWAVIWSSEPRLFSKLIAIKSISEAYDLFQLDASNYWTDHYRFGVSSKATPKSVTPALVHGIVLNVVLPLQLVFSAKNGMEIWDRIENLSKEIPMEKNTIVSKYMALFQGEDHAWNGQAFLQLHKNYCQVRRCSSCEVGNYLLKSAVQNV